VPRSGGLGSTSTTASTQVPQLGSLRGGAPAQLGRVRPRFTAVFTFLGTTAYVFTGPLNRDQVQVLTRIGGIVLIVLGLNLMGILRISRLGWSWRPLERFGAGASSAAERASPWPHARGGLCLGWTPCIGPTLARSSLCH